MLELFANKYGDSIGSAAADHCCIAITTLHQAYQPLPVPGVNHPDVITLAVLHHKMAVIHLEFYGISRDERGQYFTRGEMGQGHRTRFADLFDKLLRLHAHFMSNLGLT